MKSKIEATITLENEIASAFSGVVLGDGISIRQSKSIDCYNSDCTDDEFAKLPTQEETCNWLAISDIELENILVAHLDAEGYRYYIPALVLSILRNYDHLSMRVIGSISSLCPTNDNWPHCMHQYSLLSEMQKRALSLLLTKLPELVELNGEDARCVERAVRGYWSKYLAGHLSLGELLDAKMVYGMANLELNTELRRYFKIATALLVTTKLLQKIEKRRILLRCSQ